MNEHLEQSNVWLELAKEVAKGSEAEEQAHALVAIAEALTGILELLAGIVGDRGSVLDVRVSGSMSTGP